MEAGRTRRLKIPVFAIILMIPFGLPGMAQFTGEIIVTLFVTFLRRSSDKIPCRKAEFEETDNAHGESNPEHL